MARPLRIEFPGALYHVTARGNERRDIFFEPADRRKFLEILGQVCKRYHWLCHAYCQMTNHYHLLIETQEGNLSKGMRHLNGVYTQYVNRSYRRVGHLFQGRYKAILVEKDGYLLELARYVMLNPVRAGMVESADAWPWSSYRATVGQVPAPEFLVTEWLLSAFAEERNQAVAAFCRFVAEGWDEKSPWQKVTNQIYLGSDTFIQRVQAHIPAGRSLQDIPVPQRRLPVKPLQFYAERYSDRQEAMAEAYRSGAYSMREIGNHFGVSRMTVSRAVRRFGDGRGVGQRKA